MSPIWQIVLAVLGSSAIFTFIQFLISRHDAKHGEIQKLEEKIDKSERDSCRTQLLLLISQYPDQEEEILLVAQHYFEDLKANWYMTSIFQKYCKAMDIEIPDWAMTQNNNR